MIIKHEGNNVIKQVGESDYIEFFDCAAKLIKNSLNIKVSFLYSFRLFLFVNSFL